MGRSGAHGWSSALRWTEDRKRHPPLRDSPPLSIPITPLFVSPCSPSLVHLAITMAEVGQGTGGVRGCVAMGIREGEKAPPPAPWWAPTPSQRLPSHMTPALTGLIPWSTCMNPSQGAPRERRTGMTICPSGLGKEEEGGKQKGMRDDRTEEQAHCRAVYVLAH